MTCIFRNYINGPLFMEENRTGELYLQLLHDKIDLWLNERFPRNWMDRRSCIEWLARSPYLTPLDFFLWGCYKMLVHSTAPEDI